MILRNRIVIFFTILYLITGIVILFTPGDMISPGVSSSNEYFVENYPYSGENQKLKTASYSFWEEISFCEGKQLPQGLCITEEYVLISSYTEKEEQFGNLTVYERNTGEKVMTLVLDSNAHLGGIAYDGENIWICNSKDNVMERLRYDVLQIMAKYQKGKIIDLRNMMETYPVHCVPSGVAYYEGYLWIVTHKVWKSSKMFSYVYDAESNRLCVQQSFPIPSKVQGVTFSDTGEVYFSISYGRRSSSYIRCYDSLQSLKDHLHTCRNSLEMPPCSEQLYYENGILYVIFESAGYKYKKGTDGLGQSLCPLDKILIIDLTSS